MTSPDNPLTQAKREADTLRVQRNLAVIVATSSTIALILACALFGPPAFRKEQHNRAESVRLTIPNR